MKKQGRPPKEDPLRRRQRSIALPPELETAVEAYRQEIERRAGGVEIPWTSAIRQLIKRGLEEPW